MKNNLIVFIINIILVICDSSNENNRKFSFLLNNQPKNISNLVYNNQNSSNNIIRKLDNEDSSFTNIRIFIDKTYISHLSFKIILLKSYKFKNCYFYFLYFKYVDWNNILTLKEQFDLFLF